VLIDSKIDIEVRMLVHLSRPAVEALAVSLIAVKSIGGTEAHAILREGLPKAVRGA
jgi:hypothetical protein